MLIVKNKPFMLNVFMLNVFMLNVFMLNAFMLNVFMLSVIILSVVAPLCALPHLMAAVKFQLLSSVK
jgi:hypothetical protein